MAEQDGKEYVLVVRVRVREATGVRTLVNGIYDAISEARDRHVVELLGVDHVCVGTLDGTVAIAD